MSKKEISNEPIYYGGSGFNVVTPANKFFRIYSIVLTISLCLLIAVTILYLFLKPLTPDKIISKNASAVVAIETRYYYEEGVIVGTGSGFIVDGSGYIVTNEHVISGDRSITVYTKDGKEYGARVIGADEYYDVAVLKIFSEDENYRFPTVTLGWAKDLTVGEQVVAMGTPKERAYAWTSTVGYVSSAIRHFLESGSFGAKSYIQFDAAVNGGNSGGPVFDSRGRAVGIVEKKVADCEGIALAIPIDSVYDLIFSIIDEEKSKPQLGVVGTPIGQGVEYFVDGDKVYVVYLDEDENKKYILKDLGLIEFTDEMAAAGEVFVAEADGYRIKSVSKRSGAYGLLEEGDVIVGFDGQELSYDETSPYDMIVKILATKKAGDVVEVVFIRDGETRTENIRLTPKD
ncbi:MAG: serine protease [Clostridia bacterium]|nr:serine protease [Clostridia bacterium]